jgi:hypothetical protein
MSLSQAEEQFNQHIFNDQVFYTNPNSVKSQIPRICHSEKQNASMSLSLNSRMQSYVAKFWLIYLKYFYIATYRRGQVDSIPSYS